MSTARAAYCDVDGTLSATQIAALAREDYAAADAAGETPVEEHTSYSSDEVISRVRDVFGDRFRSIRVGQPIVISAAD